MDVLVVVGATAVPQRLAARARHFTHVEPGEATPSLIAELRSRIPREVGVLGSGDDTKRLAIALHRAGLPVTLQAVTGSAGERLYKRFGFRTVSYTGMFLREI